MLADMHYQATKRTRQQNSRSPDVSNRQWNTTKHISVPVPSANGLSECLRVTPKSIYVSKAQGKLTSTKDAPGKGYLSTNQNQNNQRRSNNLTCTLSPGFGDDGQLAVVSSRPTARSGGTRRTEECFRYGDTTSRKRVVIPQHTDDLITSVIENGAGHSARVPAIRRSSQKTTDKVNHISLPTHKILTLAPTPLTDPIPDTCVRLPIPGKWKGNTKTRNTISTNLTVSQFQKGHTTLKSSNVSNVMTVNIPKQSISGPRFRCKTSMGHYRTEPEQVPARTTKSAGFLRYRQCPDSEGITLTDSSIADLAARLDGFVTDNNIYKFQSVFLSYDPGTRQRVISYKNTCSCSSSVFFRACQLSRVVFVTLMLNECSVDLEQTGVFNVSDEDTVYQVTPLWYAAATCNLDLVRLLTSFGSNVNATSSTGCSVIRAACCVSNVPIVTVLIGKGADIHFQNEYGVTCLMSGIMSTEMTKMLIQHGSKINEVDIKGNTVLHYAAEAGRLDTVKLLVEMGANPMRRNNEKCHAIQTAAMYGQREVVDYLLRVATSSLEEMIDVFLVLGSVCIIMDNDCSGGSMYWHKAFQLKRLSNTVSRTPFRPSVLSDFVDIHEITTADQLTRYPYDHETLCLQALLIYERSKGSRDDNFLNLLMYRGAVSADNRNFRLAFHLFRTAYKLRLHKCVSVYISCGWLNMFHDSILNTLRFILKIFHNVSQEKPNSNDNHSQKRLSLSEDIARDLFRMVCQHVFSANEALEQNKDDDTKLREPFTFLLKASLAIFYGYLKIFTDVTGRAELGTNLQKLMRLNPIGINNETLLHMCLDCHLLQAYGFDTWKQTPRTWPSFVLLEILLLLGADPLARDSGGNTLLHLAVRHHGQGSVTLHLSHVRMLLRLGVHVDQVNHKLETALNLLPPGDEIRQILQETTLKCLAARVIVSHRISYVGEIPKCLYSFIELHAK